MGTKKHSQDGVGTPFYASYFIPYGLFHSLTLSVYQAPLHVYPTHENGHNLAGINCPCNPVLQIDPQATHLLIVHCLMGSRGGKVK